MKNRILIYSKFMKDASTMSEQIEMYMLKRGLFDTSFVLTNNFDDFQYSCMDALIHGGNIVAICENSKIDELCETLKEEKYKISIVNEQAILFEEKEEKLEKTKMLLLPAELSFRNFLDSFFPQKSSFVCSIFGKGEKFVFDEFSKLKTSYDMDFKILSENPFLHKVFYSKFVDEQVLKNQFGESLYSFRDENLEEKLAKLLNEKGLNISIAENKTCGQLFSLIASVCSDKIVKTNVLQNKQDFLDMGVNLDGSESLENKEIVYLLAKNMLEKTKSNLTVCAIQTNSNENEKKCFVAVGNKDSLNLFSSVFFGSQKEVVECLVEFAIFKLIDFIQTNY